MSVLIVARTLSEARGHAKQLGVLNPIDWNVYALNQLQQYAGDRDPMECFTLMERTQFLMNSITKDHKSGKLPNLLATMDEWEGPVVANVIRTPTKLNYLVEQIHQVDGNSWTVLRDTSKPSGTFVLSSGV